MAIGPLDGKPRVSPASDEGSTIPCKNLFFKELLDQDGVGCAGQSAASGRYDELCKSGQKRHISCDVRIQTVCRYLYTASAHAYRSGAIYYWSRRLPAELLGTIPRA